jgi:hypothetical protein
MDPFLLTHRVRDGLYDIGPHLSPISIRDQMIRGYTLVTRAIRENIIGPKKPLLIVGAGAAGATAAMIAAARGVETTLLERSSNAFRLQAGNQSRILNPTIYDWPAEHFAVSKFPWTGPRFPLSWEADTSLQIAVGWEAKFNDEVEDNELLTFVPNMLVDRPAKLFRKRRTGLIKVYFKSEAGTDRKGPFFFAMVISCIGAGPEVVTIGDYRGKRFWDSDAFANDNLGLPAYITPRVIISGGGDGALQDFLRIVTTKKSAKEIFESLPQTIQSEAFNINSEENQYQRAFSWSGNSDGKYKSDDCGIQSRLHARYAELIDRLIQNESAEVNDLFRRLPHKLDISLAFKCSHFSHCYPLNHFLALFLASYMEKFLGSKKVLFPDTGVVSIVPTDDSHRCNNEKPADCEEKDHNIYFVAAKCDASNDTASASPNLLDGSPYNVVIVRYGINWNDPLFGELPNGPRRHLLPYYIGW